MLPMIILLVVAILYVLVLRVMYVFLYRMEILEKNYKEYEKLPSQISMIFSLFKWRWEV